ncbi:hypothetical protein C0993_001631 [Termitomyces sp. T159_Od127]|nr:hypothetical protein C0993_001631 [Termitomyces sp. T159_Od127]
MFRNIGKPKPSDRKGTAWKREIKADDVFLSDPRESDMVVPIMGPSGSGKSTFINILIGQEVASVGHELQSHTANIQHFTLLHPDYPNRRIVIIDTPGFDDSDIDDREILRRIAVWLARSYDARMRLAGIIYLHEITQPRMLGTSRKNLDMFTRLCGPEAIRNVILVTTKWDELAGAGEGVGRLREAQLKAEHWRHMIEMGSRVYRFDGTQRAARRVVNYVLARRPVDAVQIQTELVQVGEMLAETEAGRALRYTLQELLKMQKAMAGRGEGDAAVRERALENEEKIRQTLKQIKELDIPLSRKITKFLGFVVRVDCFAWVACIIDFGLQ